ncbi:MAG: hypothetical protein K2X94_05365 [Amoebophilaceae bacterium]|nr:hypothetical protein [Amoebophilaceae bacterium]
MKKIVSALLCYMSFLLVTTSCGGNSTISKKAQFKQEAKRVIGKMKSYRSALSAIGTKDNSKLVKEEKSLKDAMRALGKLGQELEDSGVVLDSKEEAEIKALQKAFKQECKALQEASEATDVWVFPFNCVNIFQVVYLNKK